MLSLRLLPVFLGLLVAIQGSAGGSTLQVGPKNDDNALEITLLYNGATRLRSFLGLSHPSSIGQVDQDARDCNADYCFLWGDYARVELKSQRNCYRVEWTSHYARELMDCIDLDPGVQWYGGGQMYTHVYPIQKNPRDESVYIPSDSMADKERQFGGIAERYWLLSNGASIYVDPDVPLFYSLNTTRPNQVCFTARDQTPYNKRSPLTLNYEICAEEDVLATHKMAIENYFDKPTGIPDERMLLHPLWSTWAEYKTEVNQTLVLDYARRVISEGFKSSHIEIDDHWESCYGEEQFNQEKFPNAKEMMDEIKAMGLRITAWVHPFVNYECPLFNEGLQRGFFVKNTRSLTGISSWWQGSNCGVIDVTNPDAAQWWIDRLRKLQEETGLDSYKFDAGETNWLPASSALAGDSKMWPQVYTEKFTDTCANFGGMIEVRAGFQSQRHPIFFRILDKDSRWNNVNGLQSLLPSVFQFSLNGYPFIMPDMIGGNNYGQEDITQEFYIRWMQLNVFMPQIQFSLVPWRVGGNDAERAETVRLCLVALALREKYSEHILRAARQAVEDGSPMNRPIWWVDPTDSETFIIDDEYMLGDSILIAPVVYEGQTTRDVYLPRGTWVAERDSAVHTGPVWLRNYPAPLDAVPVFVKSN